MSDNGYNPKCDLNRTKLSLDLIRAKVSDDIFPMVSDLAWNKIWNESSYQAIASVKNAISHYIWEEFNGVDLTFTNVVED